MAPAPRRQSGRAPSSFPPRNRSTLKNHMRQRLFRSMRDGKRNIARAKFLRKHCGLPMKFNRRPLSPWPHYFDVAPADGVIPSCAERFHSGFFGGEASGITFKAAGFPLAVCDFAFGENTIQETVSKTLNRFAD